MNTMNTTKVENNGRWIFLAVVAGLYLIVAVIDLALVKTALFDFAMLAKKVAPILVFVFVLVPLYTLHVQVSPFYYPFH